MGGESDSENVSKTSHYETFEAAKMADEEGPSFGSEEQCWDNSGFEDSGFGFGGDLRTTVEVGFEAPEAVGCLLDTGGNLGIDVWRG